MNADYLLDTSALIAFEDELRTGTDGGAMAFLKGSEAAVMHISVLTHGEFCTVFSEAVSELRDQILGRFDTVPITERIARQYASEFARQRDEQGLPFGVNDLWIASTAVVLGFPLVVRSASHFRRIPHLSVVEI